MRWVVILMMLTGVARAEVPRVLTDIAPVQSLVAQVMGDLATPETLLSPQDDPHHFQMRPSQARLMAGADLVIWMGEAMTPWLPRVINNLGGEITSLELLELPSLPMLIEGNMATLHMPGEPVQDRAEAHSHGAVDPHAWLDPDNARAFVAAIAEALIGADPANATTYRANAAKAQARIAAMRTEIATQMEPLRRHTLVPYHDAYRYFFIRFNLQIEGALAAGDSAAPSARRIAEVREFLGRARHSCVFAEPGANLELIRTVLPEPDRRVAVLDPLGSTLAPGPGHYEALIRELAAAIAGCDQG